MSAYARALWQIHFCVLLWGFTAILGKLITLPAMPLVWWRLVLVVGALFLIPRFWSAARKLPLHLVAVYAGIGVIVALHWVLFYGAIKLSNASVTATCMATVPVCIAFVEPFIARRRFDLRELLFGVAVIPGVALVVGGTPHEMRWGIAVGIASAFLAALFATLNKKYISHSDPFCITGIEMLAGAVLLAAVSPLLPDAGSVFVVPNLPDGLLLVALAIGCTLLPFVLSLVALRQISAFTSALAINMEPVYTIVIAILLLGEQRELGLSFYAGVAIVLIVVFSHPLFIQPRRRLKGLDSNP